MTLTSTEFTCRDTDNRRWDGLEFYAFIRIISRTTCSMMRSSSEFEDKRIIEKG